MTHNVVDLDRRKPKIPPPVPDVWFTRLDARLGRIETMVARLSWQILVIACGGFGLLVLEIIQAVQG